MEINYTFNLNNLDFTVSNILFVFERKYPAIWEYVQNSRPNHGIVFITGGKALYIIDGCELTVKKNDIFFIQKGSKYLTIGDVSQPVQHIALSFDLTEDSLMPWHPIPYVYKPDSPDIFKNMFIKLHKTWSCEEIGYKVRCKTILQDIILNILMEDHNEEHKDNFLRLQPAIDYINLNFDKQISLKELSRTVLLSEPHFRRLFKRTYCLSPTEYLNNIRINEAKKMLCSGVYSIGEISGRTGFCDIFYFSRVFKKNVGMSPTDFKKHTF